MQRIWEEGSVASATTSKSTAETAVCGHGNLITELPPEQLTSQNFSAWHHLQIRHHTQRLGYRIYKRIFDILFSLFVLILFCWLYAAIAIAIKIDDPKGPVLFKQKRVTKDGREFTMYKFRSMRVDAEDSYEYLKALNEKTGPVFKLHDDPRVTRVGHFLRRTSLDEMPQFVNALKGDISVVGPRPALPEEVAEYTPRQRQRLLVKSGITCYWQTQKDRDSIAFDRWIDLDLLYIQKCGPWTDLKLIFKTIGCVLTAQGN